MVTRTQGTVCLTTGDILSSMPKCFTFQCWSTFHILKIMSNHRDYCYTKYDYGMEANWPRPYVWKWLQEMPSGEGSKKKKEKAKGEKAGCICPPGGNHVLLPGLPQHINPKHHSTEGNLTKTTPQCSTVWFQHAALMILCRSNSAVVMELWLCAYGYNCLAMTLRIYMLTLVCQIEVIDL